MACFVVFCTTYALILPVITVEQNYICGLEPHEHTDQCRAGPGIGTLLCSYESLNVHTHDGGCYAEDGTQICGIANRLLHTHDELCYGPNQTLVCQLPEVREHSHSAECFLDEVLICGQEALQEHTHSETCLDETQTRICGMTEAVAHRHSENCPVQAANVWICGMEEHTHVDTCLTQDQQMPAESTPEHSETVPTESTPESTDGTEPDPTIGQVDSVVMDLPGFLAVGDGASLTLDFTIDYRKDKAAFPQGNTYQVKVGDVVTIRLKNGDQWGDGASYKDPALTPSGCEIVSVSTKCNTHNSHYEGMWCKCFFTHEIVIRITQSNARLEGLLCGSAYPQNGNSVTIVSPEPAPTDPPVTDPTDPTEPEEPEIVKPGYPTAVKTGKSRVDTLYFYNFEATSSAVLPLAGCVFEIRSTDGSYVRRITSGDTLEVELPSDIPVGDYTITEISAPDGYLRDDNYTRSFSIGTSATLGGQKVFRNNTIGSFMNHSLEDVDASKTAEVENYNNRTYEIILNAGASVKLYEMEPIDILFVVDQSNSMLFPSGLKDTGKRIRLHQNSGWNNNWNIGQANLDKNQLYYIIADPQGTSTVFALWHNGTSWMYQDASYYAKAFYENAEGYRQDNETAIFPKAGEGFQGTSEDKKYKANGGDIGYELGGSLGSYIGDGGNKEFAIYTAVDQYNRLHYLEESITQAVYQLSDVNEENTVTLIRFTKEVDASHCMGPLEMTPENANRVVEAVNKIQTDGGTRQDLALDHAHKHLTGNIPTNDGGSGDHYTKDKEHTFTILITDGAPVRSGSDAPALDTIYSQIRTNGAKVRQESTLVTIGLGMGAVEGGKQVLEDIASEPHSMYANMLDDASDLTGLLQDLIFSSMSPREHDAIPGEITDVISDSFYPIAWVNKGEGTSTGRQVLFSDDRDWVVLEPGDWVDIEGRFLGTNQGYTGEGQLTRESNGDLVMRWKDRQLKGNPSWTGRFFVKAKEDFIGGNVIETNKSARVEVNSLHLDEVLARIELPNPTVNVRLLDMNQMNSEVTVFLGDLINEPGNSPLNALEYFYYNTRFTKLVGDLPNRGGVDYGPIMNAIDPDVSAEDGLEKGTFSLRYAMGADLTAEQWEHLTASEDHTVRVEYTYDDASSHGPVGYFTFRLTKSGQTADYQTHEATVAGEHVEEYILHVTYTAYELGENNRPERNVYNGSGSPGTEVADENGNGRLEEGYGIVDKDNVHVVNVISGAIEVTKEITGDLISDTDQTFLFTLHRTEDGDDRSGDRHLEVVIPAGQTTATVRTENLHRGTWVLSEQASEVYNIQALTILDTTNCYSLNEGTTAVFHIGDDTSDRNVIGKTEGARYTSYTGTPNGVFGAARVVNEKTYYYDELPVEKVWSGHAPADYSAGVYVVLFRNVDGVEQLMLDTDGNARILRLDSANGWKASFRVALPHKNADVTTMGYFVREVGGITLTPQDNSQPAILENDGTTLLYYAELAQPEDILALHGNLYMVTYEETNPGSWTVTNHIAVTLPSTGGHGTTPYTISGLLLVAAALIIGYSQRRKRERRAAV